MGLGSVGSILRVVRGAAFAGMLLAGCIWAWHAAFPDAFPDFRERSVPGCYWRDALVGFIECRGFAGSGLAAYLLNLPHALFMYTPMFALYALFNSPLGLLHPWYIFHLGWLVLGISFVSVIFGWLFPLERRR